VDDAAAATSSNFRMDAYRSGLTYGPGLTGTYGTDTITTTHGFFWAPTSMTESGSIIGGNDGTMYKLPLPSGYIVDVYYNFTNYDPNFAYTIQVTATLKVAWLQGTLPLVTQIYSSTPAAITITVPAAHYSGTNLVPGTAQVWVPFFPVTNPDSAKWEVDYTPTSTILVTAGNPIYVGKSFGDFGYFPNEWPAYASTTGIATMNTAWIAGDIAGGTLAPPYYGADGVINARDLSALSGVWLQSVPSGSGPKQTIFRADLNHDGVINARDLSILAGNWLKSWSITTLPPSPSTLPYPL